MTNTDAGSIVGGWRKILNTTDGRTNWLAQSRESSNVLKSVYFIDTHTGWAVGEEGTILKTTTSGVTFVKGILHSESIIPLRCSQRDG